jgi:hypothetical protein
MDSDGEAKLTRHIHTRIPYWHAACLKFPNGVKGPLVLHWTTNAPQTVSTGFSDVTCATALVSRASCGREPLYSARV